VTAYTLDPARLRLVAEMLTAATNPSHDAAEQIAAGVCLEAEAEIVRLRAEVERAREFCSQAQATLTTANGIHDMVESERDALAAEVEKLRGLLERVMAAGSQAEGEQVILDIEEALRG
jgi:hypothetical protein